MRRLRKRGGLLAIGVALLAGIVACPARADGTGAESELVALSDAWIAAEVQHDRAALERILDERFLATFTSGKTVDRAAYVERILAADIPPFTVLNESVQVFGDVGLVISTTTDRTMKFTWVAVLHGAQWRVISETFSRVTPAP
jgi:hypothetical protein